MGLVLQAELEPVFTTRVERRSKKIQTGGRGKAKTVVEVALDQGEISAENGTRSICELELELVEGTLDALLGLAIKLNEETPLVLETVSKSEHGYALATGQAVSWIKAENPVFEPRISLDGAIDGIFRACIRHWLANHAAVLEGSDPESVHQLRIALRRLRSALAVFKGVLPAADAAWINGEARWLLQSLGAARDWDVFLTELLPPLQSAREENGDFAALQSAAADARWLAYECARSDQRSARYTAFVLELGRWIYRAGWRGTEAPARYDELLGDYACQLLRKRHRLVLKQGRDFESLSDEELHRLRITLKKLRYTSEFFASLYPKSKAGPYLKALKSLQDELGHMNDVVVSEDLLKGLLGSADVGNMGALRAAASMVIGWYAHAVTTRRPRIEKRWQAFTASKPFWNVT